MPWIAFETDVGEIRKGFTDDRRTAHRRLAVDMGSQDHSAILPS
jgi:hypothetical protein